MSLFPLGKRESESTAERYFYSSTVMRRGNHEETENRNPATEEADERREGEGVVHAGPSPSYVVQESSVNPLNTTLLPQPRAS